jgi:hypothetical protein
VKEQAARQQVVAPHLLDGLPPEPLARRGVEAAHRGGDLLVACTVRRGRVAEALVVLHLDPREARRPLRRRVLDEDVERRAISREAGIAPAGRMLELDRRHAVDATVRETTEDAAGEREIVLQLAEEVERHRLRGEEVVPDARLPEQLALATRRIEHLATEGAVLGVPIGWPRT